MTKVSIICLPLILMWLVFISVGSPPSGFDLSHVACLIAAFVVFCIERSQIGRGVTVAVVLLICFVLMQEVESTYRYWPIALGRKHQYKMAKSKATEVQLEKEQYIRIPGFDETDTNKERTLTLRIWLSEVSDLWLYPLLIIGFTCLITTIEHARTKRRITMAILALAMLLIVGIVMQCRCDVWLYSIGGT